MGCSRCGQNSQQIPTPSPQATPRPAPRPGSFIPNPAQPTTNAPDAAIRNAISGLKYVPR